MGRKWEEKCRECSEMKREVTRLYRTEKYLRNEIETLEKCLNEKNNHNN